MTSYLAPERHHDNVRGKVARINCLQLPCELLAFARFQGQLLAAARRPILRIDINGALDARDIQMRQDFAGGCSTGVGDDRL